MKRTIGFLIILSLTAAQAQDSIYARKCISKLCSKSLHGRGYYKNGAQKAAEFIQAEMALFDSPGELQTFGFQVNTILGNPLLVINGVRMKCGTDFQVSADCPVSKGSEINSKSNAEIVIVGAENVGDSIFREKLTDLIAHPGTGVTRVCIIDTMPESLTKKYQGFLTALKQHFTTVFFVKNKLTWTVATEQSSQTSFDVLRKAYPYALSDKDKLGMHIRWKVQSSLAYTKQSNVVGMVKGRIKPDSFIIVCAHYDHLGQMGKKAIFQGANDNAAGVAMLLDLAKYYQNHPAPYTLVFIAFAGEEAGLIGSYYFVNHPLCDLSKTRFVLNLDLVGTGETGITVVNATEYKQEFALLESINSQNHYLNEIKKRGKAANSDHYFFTEAGVPSFFWYQGGPRTAYHDVEDVPETLTLFAYDATFLLARDFFSALTGP